MKCSAPARSGSEKFVLCRFELFGCQEPGSLHAGKLLQLSHHIGATRSGGWSGLLSLHCVDLRLKLGEDFTVVNPEQDERHREFWMEYHRLMMRRGITAQYAKLEMRRRTTLIAAMLLRKGAGDGMICGTISTTAKHLQYIDRVIGKSPGSTVYAAMNALILPERQVFIVDTHVNLDPTAEQLAEITRTVARCPAVLVMTSRLEGDPLDAMWRTSVAGSPVVTIDVGPLRSGGNNVALHPDGKRFAILKGTPSPERQHVSLMLDAFAEVRRVLQAAK